VRLGDAGPGGIVDLPQAGKDRTASRDNVLGRRRHQMGQFAAIAKRAELAQRNGNDRRT
jgi:hypothetical protein